MKRRILIAEILLAALLLCGCTEMEIQSTSVTLACIDVIKATLFEQRLVIKLRVLNSNHMEIPISGLSF